MSHIIPVLKSIYLSNNFIYLSPYLSAYLSIYPEMYLQLSQKSIIEFFCENSQRLKVLVVWEGSKHASTF